MNDASARTARRGARSGNDAHAGNGHGAMPRGAEPLSETESRTTRSRDPRPNRAASQRVAVADTRLTDLRRTGARAPRTSGGTGSSSALRRRFVALLERLAPVPGRTESGFPGLTFVRATRPVALEPSVYRPAFCVVAQGAKEATLGEHLFRYDPFQYLVIGAPMPVRSRIVEATETVPYLSLALEIPTSEVRELLREIEDEAPARALWSGAPPLRTSPLDDRLLEAVVRFLEAVADPMDRRVLAPAALREIVYLALRREQGDLLRLALRADRRSPGVARALQFIHTHLEERFDVGTLARAAGMSVSALHHGFKSATTLSPVQYVKRIRLDRARQLIVDEGCQAAEAALRVGYESPSQFSREFKRVFGLPPRQYVQSQTGAA